MAAVVKGTAHIFGSGATITNATVIGINVTHGFELNSTTEDGTGVTIETRRDNRKKTLTATVRIQSAFSDPALGSAITLAGLQTQFNGAYELVSIGGKYGNTEFVELELNLEKYEGVAVS
jgi:hypothetical protein